MNDALLTGVIAGSSALLGAAIGAVGSIGTEFVRANREQQ